MSKYYKLNVPYSILLTKTFFDNVMWVVVLANKTIKRKKLLIWAVSYGIIYDIIWGYIGKDTDGEKKNSFDGL